VPRFVSDIHCSIVKPNRSSDVICSVSRRRDIVLRAWNYPGVQNFSRTDPLYRNSYSFTIPVVSTLSSATCSKFLDLLQSDMKGDLPFQVCVLRVCLSYAPLFSLLCMLCLPMFSFADEGSWLEICFSNHGDEAVINRHLVHSSFKGWEHLDDYFLAVLIQRLFSMLEQRGEVLNAHLKYLQAFSVCILYFTSKLFLPNNISLNSCVPSCRISLIIVHLPCGASPTNLHCCLITAQEMFMLLCSLSWC